MNTPVGDELGGLVKAARTKRGWSLADVASRTGLSRAYINALEHGRARRPGADALRRLEDVLGPIRQPGDLPATVPAGLQELAKERDLPTSEVVTLAALRIGGRQPASRERWRFIYDALVASESMDGGPDRGS